MWIFFVLKASWLGTDFGLSYLVRNIEGTQKTAFINRQLSAELPSRVFFILWPNVFGQTVFCSFFEAMLFVRPGFIHFWYSSLQMHLSNNLL